MRDANAAASDIGMTPKSAIGDRELTVAEFLALTYGIPPTDIEPPGGVWDIWKHRATGILLGPSIPMGMAADPAYAEVTREDGWRELTADEARARRRMAGLYD